MKLRSQMLLAGVLTLAVPLVGWQSVKQLYSALQQTRIEEQTLKVANMRLALSETADIGDALGRGQATTINKDWYAESTPYPVFIDGYDDDWQTLVSDPFFYRNEAGSAGASVRIARHEDKLYLFVSVVDEQVVYHTPPVLIVDAGEGEQPNKAIRLVNGDSVELLIERGTGSGSRSRWQHALFRTIAPGPVEALTAVSGREITDWQGAWVKTNAGYQLEVELPLPASGSRVGIAVWMLMYPENQELAG